MGDRLIELNVFLKRFCKLGSGFLSTGQCPTKDTEDTPICSQKIVAATIFLSIFLKLNWQLKDTPICLLVFAANIIGVGHFHLIFFPCINMYLLNT